MTVGILGMSFKADSDDTRSSLSYKLKRILSFKAKRVLTTDPYVTTDPQLRPLEQVLAEADLLVVGNPPLPVPRPRHRQAGCRHLERARQGGACVTPAPRVSVIIPAHNEGDAIVPVLDRLFESITLDCEVLVVVDVEDDTTIEPVEKYAAAQPRLRVVVQTYGNGPANAIRYGFHVATAPVAVVTMADGCDDPRQIDDLTRLVERGVVVAAASRYMPGGQQVGGPVLKGFLSRAAGRSLHWFARVGTRDPTNSYKAFSTRVRRGRRHRQPQRLRDRARAHGQGAPAALAGRRDTHDLAGPAGGHVQLQARQVVAEVPSLVPLRLRPGLDVVATASGAAPQAAVTAAHDSRSNRHRRASVKSPRQRLVGVHRRLRRRGAPPAGPSRSSGIDNFSKYGKVRKSYDGDPELLSSSRATSATPSSWPSSSTAAITSSPAPP